MQSGLPFRSRLKRALITRVPALAGLRGRLRRLRPSAGHVSSAASNPTQVAREALGQLTQRYPVGESTPMRDLALPALELVVCQRFLQPEIGHAYGVTPEVKLALLNEFKANTQRIPSATSWLYHVVLATEILAIPPEVAGGVIECGCWQGGSTANLSLACSLVNRRLAVCDSFDGLPADDKDVVHQYPHIQVFGYYQPGMYVGRLADVRQNIARWGKLEVCDFVPGFFADTLPSQSGPVAFAFLDVDLVSSMRDCLRYLWPRLVEGGLIYTDDSCDMEVVRVWFDDNWWQANLGLRAPGYVGSGSGLPLSPDFSSLGYARKTTDPTATFNRVNWLYYPDEASGKKPLP